MDRSKPVFHAISVVILLIVIVLYWKTTSELTNIDGNLGSDERAMTSLPLLNEHLVWMIPVLFIAILVSVVSAFIIEECLSKTNWLRKIIEPQIGILGSIPSIIYGILGIYYFIIHVPPPSFYSLTYVVLLLIFPVTTLSTQKVIQNVDVSIREAAYALGANRWRVITDHVFPLCFIGILMSICNAISRALLAAVLFIVVFVWGVYTSDTEIPLNIPNSVGVLLGLVLCLSVFSSLLKKNS